MNYYEERSKKEIKEYAAKVNAIEDEDVMMKYYKNLAKKMRSHLSLFCGYSVAELKNYTDFEINDIYLNI